MIEIDPTTVTVLLADPLSVMAIGTVVGGIGSLFQGIKGIATAPSEDALRTAQLQQMRDDKTYQKKQLQFQEKQGKFQRAQAILGRSQAQFQRSQAESQRFQSQLAQQQFNVNVQAKNRQDQLALESANLNVEAINKQIGNRQDVLKGEIGAYDKQSRGILGEQRAAMGASGAAIMAGSSGHLVEEEIGAVRTTGRERIEQQSAFDVERLQFEQARHQKQADVLDPMQTGKVQDQYQQSTKEISDITADPVPSLSWLDDNDDETIITDEWADNDMDAKKAAVKKALEDAGWKSKEDVNI